MSGYTSPETKGEAISTQSCQVCSPGFSVASHRWSDITDDSVRKGGQWVEILVN